MKLRRAAAVKDDHTINFTVRNARSKMSGLLYLCRFLLCIQVCFPLFQDEHPCEVVSDLPLFYNGLFNALHKLSECVSHNRLSTVQSSGKTVCVLLSKR